MIKSTKTRYNNKFYYHNNDEMIGRSIDLYGEYAQVEVDFLLSFLNKDCVVYDIGANIGYHTTAFASLARKVYAFEPHPKNYALLEQNTEDFSNVYIGNYAVSNSRSVCYINDYDPQVAGNFGAVSVVDYPTSIEAVAIDLDTAGLDLPDFIKIDVEGYELQVLEGCRQIIEHRCPVVYYEAHESKDLKEIYELLSPDRYRFYWAQVNNYNPNNFAKNDNNVFGGTALMSILAWPKTLAELSMTPVEGPNDTAGRFYVDGHP
jgi:FkbM family methyltransferase